ncbi:MAG: hypothetical protein Q9181_007510, partial [Wetmoreana brouardii]
PVYTTMYKEHPEEKMLACQYMGPKTMVVNSVPKPMITAPKDAIVKITHCTVCGSDLHMYAGDLDSAMKKGDIMGHEAIGFVDDVGPEVKNVEKGDRVIILPVVATNPSKEMEGMWGHRLSGIFGYTQLTGGYPGNQAEYCRVPNADLILVKAPKKGVSPEQLLANADVTTTAWHGNELAEVGKGHVVGVWGCGPVGLSIAKLALFRGAKKVYAVDPDPRRLEIAESFGCIGVNVREHPDVSDYILRQEPHGLDKGIEASGFRSAQSWIQTTMRAIGAEGDQSDTVSHVIKATRKGGNIALIGDFFFTTNQFPIGALMEKAITLRGGQLYAQKSKGNMILHSCSHTKVSLTYAFSLFALPFLYKFEDLLWGDTDFRPLDDFENIPEMYKLQFEHGMPGGLKAIMATPFGRSLGK